MLNAARESHVIKFIMNSFYRKFIVRKIYDASNKMYIIKLDDKKYEAIARNCKYLNDVNGESESLARLRCRSMILNYTEFPKSRTFR